MVAEKSQCEDKNYI